jgi:P27 family predicted phage terminase small subunit
MPEALSPREAREWRRLCDLLTAAGVMTVADGDALEGYVKALEMARQAEAMLQKDGLVVEAAEGEKAHPAVSIAKLSRLAVKQFGALFGLDPSSRAALNVPKPEKTDEIGDFLSGKSRGLSVVK